MNALNPKKLLNSKWTAAEPRNRERHFIITEVEFDDNGAVIHCLIEAVATRRSMSIHWRELRDSKQWQIGWR